VTPSGYSGTPLAKKLGIRAGFKIRLINAPENYFALFTDFPGNVDILTETISKKDFIHCFSKDIAELKKIIPDLKSEITSNGMIWISWPKKRSGISATANEDSIRSLALATGLVDIKVCAVDDTWSALKLVIPVKSRIKL
jgi:hypothetical protein